jgi:FkbM family methyltransferase
LPAEADEARARLVSRILAGEEVEPAGFAPVLGERAQSLDRNDVLCLRGHLLYSQPTVDTALRILSNPAAVTAVIQLRKLVAGRLFDCAGQGGPFPLTIKHAFGLLSVHHEEALRRAIRRGRFRRSHALLYAYNGEALTKLLSGASAKVPLQFYTSNGDQDREIPNAGEVAFDVPYTLAAGGGSFQVMVSSPLELWRATTLESTEPETLEWLAETLTPQSVFYDVGANIGLYALYALHLAPGSAAVCFEPEPINLARLNRNLQVNGCRTALAFPVALADETGPGRFTVRSFMAGAASPFAIENQDAGTAAQVGCVQYTLDDFLRGAPFLQRPTHLKIDVDGAQMRVLRGARETLRTPAVRHVLIELFEDEAAQAADLLAAAGFEPTGTWQHTPPVGERGRVGNYIYRRSA